MNAIELMTRIDCIKVRRMSLTTRAIFTVTGKPPEHTGLFVTDLVRSSHDYNVFYMRTGKAVRLTPAMLTFKEYREVNQS